MIAMHAPAMRVSPLALAVIGATACAAFDGPSLPQCVGGATVSVTPVAQPVFAWTPDCRVDQIVVTNVLAPSIGVATNQPQWTATTRAAVRGVVAPITYGQAPVGMKTTYGPTSLNRRQQYEVLISARGVVVGNAFFFIP